MYIGLYVRYPLLESDFKETWISSTDLGKYSGVKFHGNSSRGSRVIPRGWTDI